MLSASISFFSCSNVASYPVDNERTTKSTPPIRGISLTLTSSRNRLLKRLRSTIVCPYFATTTATRACESRESMARTSRCSVRSRLPARFTFSKSDSRVSLWLRGYPYCLGAGVLARQPYSQLLPPLLPTAAQYLATPPG